VFGRGKRGLQGSELRLASLLVEELPGCALIVASDLTVSEVLSGSDRLLGYSSGELVTRGLRDVATSADTADLDEIWERVLANDAGPETFVVDVQHGDGSSSRLRAVAHNLVDDPLVGGVVLILYGVDERVDVTRTGPNGAWYRAFVEYGSDAVVGVDSAESIRIWNEAASEMFGYRSDEILGRPLSLLLPEEARENHVGLFRSFAQGDRERRIMGVGATFGARHRDGGIFPVEIAISKVPVDDVVMLMASVRDVSHRDNLERTLAERNTELLSVMEAIPDSICRLRADGLIVDVVPSAGQLVPFTTEVTGRNVAEVVPAELADRTMHVIRQVTDTGTVVSFEFDESDLGTGGDRSFECRYARLGTEEVLVMIRDVTERLRAESDLAHAAMHDALTGLPNRTLLWDRLSHALRRSERDGGIVVLILLDLDGFKRINDRLGHEMGDRVLVSVAELLAGTIRSSETLARLGGDEFAVLVEGIEDVNQMFSIAKRVAGALKPPIQLGDRTFHITASIGIGCSKFGDADATTMLRNSDSAMYHAKDRGRDRIEIYDNAIQAALDRRVEIESSLRRAIELQELEIYYQPIVELRSGTMTGVEALLRWSHPEMGAVSPAEFIPIAEDCGLIFPIGQWVLRHACLQAVDWHKRLNRPLKMSVNVSARQLVDPGFSELVSLIVAETEINREMLSVEVTETAVIDQRETALTNLENIRNLGVQIALDDFGTGYASLSYLRDLPITHIKIDRTFTAAMTDDQYSTTIIESTITLAHGLGHTVIAEGVETAEQLRLLTRLGCDKAQGYHLGRPQTANDIEQLPTYLKLPE